MKLIPSNARKRFILELSAYAALFIILTVCGLLFQDARVGRWLIITYGLVAFVMNIPSVDTYRMGAISLLYTPFLAFVGNGELVASFAEYAFLLFVFGTVNAVKEEWKEGRRARKLRLP